MNTSQISHIVIEKYLYIDIYLNWKMELWIFCLFDNRYIGKHCIFYETIISLQFLFIY